MGYEAENMDENDHISDDDPSDELAGVICKNLSDDAANCMQSRVEYNQVVSAILTRWQLTPIPGSTPREPWTPDGKHPWAS